MVCSATPRAMSLSKVVGVGGDACWAAVDITVAACLRVARPLKPNLNTNLNSPLAHFIIPLFSSSCQGLSEGREARAEYPHHTLHLSLCRQQLTGVPSGDTDYAHSSGSRFLASASLATEPACPEGFTGHKRRAAMGSAYTRTT